MTKFSYVGLSEATSYCISDNSELTVYVQNYCDGKEFEKEHWKRHFAAEMAFLVGASSWFD